MAGDVIEIPVTDGLSFYEDGHVYRIHGVVVPSVTTILEAAFPISGKERDSMRYIRDFGKHVHLCTQLSDAGVLDETSVLPAARPYLDAWRTFVMEEKPEIFATEIMVYHPIRRYAGTVDRVLRRNGEFAVLDIKTGESWPSYGPQLAAYQRALEYGLPNLKRYCIYLMANGRYKIEPHLDHDDWPVFVASHTLYNFKRRMKCLTK